MKAGPGALSCLRLLLGLLLLGAPAARAAGGDPLDLYGRAANLLSRRGLSARERDQAVQLLLEAREQLRGRAGSRDLLAQVLRLLGTAYLVQSSTVEDGEAAAQAYREALGLRQEQLREATSAYAAALRDWLAGEEVLGRGAQLEVHYQRLLGLQEDLHGASSGEAGRSARQLGRFYLEQGEFGRAEAQLRRALAVAETQGDDQEQLRCSQDLAVLGYSQGRREEARGLLQRLLDRAAARRWPAWQRVGLLSFLIAVAQADGDREQALRLSQQALGLLPSQPGDGAQDQVMSDQEQRAQLLRLLGQHAAAERLYRDLLGRLERARGPGSRAGAGIRVMLGAAVAAQGRSAEAAALLREALQISEVHLQRERLAYGEERLRAQLRLLREGEERWIYTLLGRDPQSAPLADLALRALLLRKGRVLDELSFGRRLLRDLSPQVELRVQELRALRSRYAALSLRGPEGLSPERYQGQLRELEAQAEALERSLEASLGRSRRAGPAVPPVGEVLERAAAALPADGALLEFVAYTSWDLDLRGPSGSAEARQRYLLLMLLPDGKVAAFPLGAAAPIQRAAEGLIRAVSDRTAPRDAYRAPAEQLGRLLLGAPGLAALLGGRRRLFLSPDGILHLLPFSVLQPGGSPLADAYQLAYVTSGRDLLRRLPPAAVRPAREMVVLADPDFHAAPVAAGPLGLGGAPAPRGLWDRSFSSLPGTRREAEAIRQRFSEARLLLGGEATEPALLSLPAPGVLHVATHGLFLADGADAPGRPLSRGLILGGRDADLPPPNPLLRSALVLAGAAAPLDRRLGSMADGMATALEVAGMDLLGTQLVVLSACETGLGETTAGEGVYGLRRAVLAAGAETLVTSLWRVDDAATEELMTAYYDGLLQRQGRSEALQGAAQALRRRRPHPYFWAPFISVGRWEPLLGLPGAGPAPSPPPPPAQRPVGNLWAVWAAGPERIFAAGERGGLWRWEGGGWKGELGHAGGVTFYGLWGRRDGAVYAAGEQGALLRWDGARWQPLRSGTRRSLQAVWGDDQGLFVAGEAGTMLSGEAGDLLPLPSRTSENLFALAGDRDALYAAGANQTVLRWDRTRRAMTALPAPLGSRPNPGPHFFSVHVRGGGVYVAGEGVWRWDGTGWQRLVAADARHLAPLGPARESAWLVLGAGPLRLLLRGTEAQPLPRETRLPLHAVASQGDAALVVGAEGLVLRGDGARWQRLSGPAPEDERWDWLAAWGSGPRDLWVVGEAGQALHYDGERWRRVDTGTAARLTALWGSGPREVYTAGQSGTLLAWDGERWRSLPSGVHPKISLQGLWGPRPGAFYAVGDQGTVLYRDERGVRPVPVRGRGAASADLGAVWGAPGAQEVYLAGYHSEGAFPEGLLLRGGELGGFQVVPLPSCGPLMALGPGEDGELRAVGDAVTVRVRGGRTLVQRTLEPWRLHGVFSNGPGRSYAVGADGTEGLLARWHGGRWVRVPLPQPVPRLVAGAGAAGRLLLSGWGGTHLLLTAP